ncbi:winged helix-turn-helix domain-containing protein [Yersinia enterocolitica]|uniref:winged helix-turn-helix domain-containing protein n=1 Tax=Yersinia TaxID=629 RepID=UPI003AB67AB5
MKYILNFSLVFTPEQKSLVLLDNGDSELTLSAPASRLLVELIKSNGTTISRDELLKNVWEDYGFVGSNSNLNSYISEIRKAFTSLGCDSKMIVTIPKSGLQFSANVETVLITENAAILTESTANHQKQPLMETTDVSGERNKTEDNNSYNTKKFITSGKIIIIFTIIVLCTVLAIFYVNVENPKVLPSKKTVFLFKENNCSVYSLGNRGEKSLDDLIKIAKADLKQNNIVCTVQHENIFHYRVFENNSLSSYSFISRCTINNEGKATYCKTLIRHDR